MMKRIAALLALALSISATSALACPGDKAKPMDGKTDISKPKPTT
jgi:hypothetical protein